MHKSVPSFKEVVRDIGISLTQVDDSKASQIGLIAMAGSRKDISIEKYLLFSIGTRRIATAITGITEVGDMPKVTRLPNVPSWVMGIANIHNEIISVIDLERFMNWKSNTTHVLDKMVVLGGNDLKVAIGISSIIGTYNRTIDQESSENRATGKEFEDQFFRDTMVVGKQEFQIFESMLLLAHKKFISCDA